MVGTDRARKIALSLPEAVEQDHMGHPSFRVRKKIFATLWPEERRVVVKLPLDVQAGLVEGDPKAFSLNSWSKHGWTNVHLQHVSVPQLRALMDQSWRSVAPRSLVTAQGSPARKPRR